MHRGEHRSEGPASPVEIPPQPPREVVGQRLNDRLSPQSVRVDQETTLLLRHGFQHSDRPATLRTPSKFCSPKDGRDLGNVGVHGITRHGELRRAADAPRIHELRRSALRISLHACAEAHDLGAFDEERPPLVEADLKGGEVHHRWVLLHLSEIGIEGGVEREVGSDAVFHVSAHCCTCLGTLLKWVGETDARILRNQRPAQQAR